MNKKMSLIHVGLGIASEVKTFSCGTHQNLMSPFEINWLLVCAIFSTWDNCMQLLSSVENEVLKFRKIISIACNCHQLPSLGTIAGNCMQNFQHVCIDHWWQWLSTVFLLLCLTSNDCMWDGLHHAKCQLHFFTQSPADSICSLSIVICQRWWHLPLQNQKLTFFNGLDDCSCAMPWQKSFFIHPLMICFPIQQQLSAASDHSRMLFHFHESFNEATTSVRWWDSIVLFSGFLWNSETHEGGADCIGTQSHNTCVGSALGIALTPSAINI